MKKLFFFLFALAFWSQKSQAQSVTVSLEASILVCNGATNGTIVTTVNTNLPGPLLFDWADLPGSNDPQNRTGLGAGTYSVIVTNTPSGITGTASVTLTQPLPNVASTSVQNLVCNGQNTGSIFLTMNGASTQFSYDWADIPGSSNPPNRTNLAPGSYTVTVTKNPFNCVSTHSFTVTQPMPFSPNATIENAACAGAANGSITLAPTGGTPNYSFDWADLPGTNNPQNRTGLASGTYFLTVSDVNQCSYTAFFTVGQAPPLALTATVQNVFCNGEFSGGIDPEPSGGVPPYAFDWADIAGANNPQFRTSIAAGTYNCTMTDAGGCTKTLVAVVAEPPAVALSSVVSNVACFGAATGAVVLTAAGGTGGFSFNWADLPGANDPKDRTNLAAGSFSVTATDANGCSKTASVTVAQPTAAVAATAVLTHLSCAGSQNGAIDLTASGGTGALVFDWADLAGSNDPQDRTDLAAGVFSVAVTDANGCSISQNHALTEPPPMAMTLVSLSNATCGAANGAATVLAVGGSGAIGYAWSNGQIGPTATGLAAGNYTATATDAAGCTKTITASISSTSSFQLGTADVVGNACFGQNNGSINPNPVGGMQPYSFLWSNGSTAPSLSGLAAGAFSLTATDAAGCQAVGAFQITEPPELTVSKSAIPVSCFNGANGAATVLASGGTPNQSILWSNGSTLFQNSNLAAGVFSFTVTDANGCKKSGDVTIGQPSAVNLSIHSTDPTCFGQPTGAAQAVASGGTGAFSFTWSNGQTGASVANLVAGQIGLFATDANGCSATAQATIAQPAQILANAAVVDAACFGQQNGSISIVPPTGGTPPFSFLWQNGQTSASISGLAAGDFSVSISDGAGCVLTKTFQIQQPAALAVAETEHSDIVCGQSFGGLVKMVAAGGTAPFSFNWSSGETTDFIASKKAGTYSVSVTDAHGCSAFSTVLVLKKGQLDIQFLLKTEPTCLDSMGTAVVGPVFGGFPPFQFDWSNGQKGQSASGLPGLFEVIARDSMACADTAQIQLNYAQNLLKTQPSVQNPTCGDGLGSIVLNPTGGVGQVSILWSNGQTGQILDNLPVGTYSATTTDATGCAVVNLISLTAPPVLVLELLVTEISAAGAMDGAINLVSATGGAGPLTVLPALPLLNLGAGSYIFELKDSLGCSVRDTAVILGAAPVPAFSASATEGCAPLTVQLFDQSAGNPTSWEWQFVAPFGVSPTSSTAQNPTIFMAAPSQSVNVILKTCNALGCTEKLFVQAVVVKPDPISDFTFSTTAAPLTVQFDGQFGNAQSILWNFGDGTTSDLADPLHVFPAAGSFDVSLRAMNECDTATTTKTVALTVAARDFLDGKAIRIFPNPTAGKCRIEADFDLKNARIECFSAFGSLLFVAEKKTGRTGELDFSALPRGVFWLKITDGDGRQALKKLVVAR